MDATITFERAMALAKNLKRLNQSKAEPRPHRNPVEEIKRWQRQPLQYLPAKIDFSSSDAHCCKTPFEDLKPINLREMEIPKIHRGRYLVCKVVGKPVAEIGVYSLIQDLNDDVEETAFYNFCYNLDDIDWISVGTILVIKEPWLQYSRHKTPALRTESPSDVIFIDPADEGYLDKLGAMKWYEPVTKDAELWREKANDYFKNGKFEKALFFYDRGIRCNPDLAVLYLNKSLTHLRTGAYYLAYQSAKLGLEKGGDREKALYRLGQAAYGMREWQKASKHFCDVLKEFPGHTFASEQLKRATARLAEQRNGKFDLKQLHVESLKDKPRMDVADYAGPIEIANIPGKGRGIIASKDIKKGTLLVVSKAFGSGFAKDFPQSLFTRANIVQNDPRGMTQVLQFVDTVQTLKNNPQRAKEIYDLYAGEDTVEKDEIPEGVIDVARLEKICTFNRFGSPDGETEDECGLHIIPSYFNHSCLANTGSREYDDVKVILASADIKKGEEICLAYVSLMEEYSARRKGFESWNFICTCNLCEIDSKDDLCFKRNQLLEEFKEFAEKNKNFPKKVVEKGEEILKKIRETYAKRKVYKIVLAQMLFELYPLYCSVATLDYSKGLQCLEEILILVDDSLSSGFNIAKVYFVLSNWYLALGNMVKSRAMKQKAVETSFCTDVEHLEMMYRIKPV